MSEKDIANGEDDIQNLPCFDRRTTSMSEGDPLDIQYETETVNEDMGFTTDGEVNRHSPDRDKKKTPRRLTKREVEKMHFDMVNERVVEDITIDVFYKPHTITLLGVIAACLAYKAFSETKDTLTSQNVYEGFLATVLLFLIVSALAFPNGPFIRPHPLLWRVIFGLSVAYLLLLQFALFQTYDDLKSILTWLDPEGLGRHELAEKEYAVDCWNISFAKVWSHFDFFAFSHFTGWIMKTLLIRHWVLCWYISCMWELTELIFVQLLPNFAECWWDALILDIVVCNGVGIYIGMKLCKFLQMRQYHWESMRNIKSKRGRMKRFVMQFTPESWNQFEWFYSKNFTNMLNRTVSLVFFVLFWLVAELNTFFIKHIFSIDTQHPVVFWRIILLALIAAPTIRQFYVYATDPLVKRIGMQCWVFVVICVLEAAICFKCGRGLFSNLDAYLIVLWVGVVVLGTIVCIYASVWYVNWSGEAEKGTFKGRPRMFYLDSSHENLGLLHDDVVKRRNEYLGKTPVESDLDIH